MQSMNIFLLALLISAANAERNQDVEVDVHKHSSLGDGKWQRDCVPLKHHTAALQQRYQPEATKSDVNAPTYTPQEYNHEILSNPKSVWADPPDFRDALKADPELVEHQTYFNQAKCPDIDRLINLAVCDNNCWDRVLHPLYSQQGRANIPTQEVNGKLRPQNPMGRTGMTGRGLLGKWGANQAADPVVVRCNKPVEDQPGKIQVAVILRSDTSEWALPGGMRDKGEATSLTAKREFQEEANGKGLDMNGAFSAGTPVYTGYVDDPRNTDNAWMETAVYLFRNDAFFGQFDLKGADDAKGAKWRDMQELVDGAEKLYASHSDFVKAAWDMIADKADCRPQ